MTNMGEIVQTVNTIADKNDRWLLIATGVLLVSFGFLVFRWLIARVEKLLDQNNATQSTLLERHITVLERNTAAFENVSKTIDRLEAIWERNSSS